MQKTQQGFSLVELSIVLVVVGLLLGTTIAGLSDFIWHARNAQAKEDLALIQEALIGFAISNGGLPCPDTTGYSNNPDNADGTADDDGLGNCIDDEGFLPWADLGLKRNDPWGTPYVYRIDLGYSKPPPMDNAVTFALTDADGTLEVRISPPAGAIVANAIAAVFLSVGPNGYGHLIGTSVPSADESANFDDDGVPGTFVDKAYKAVTPGDSGFDDIVSWLSTFTLKAKMVEAQRLP